MNGRRSPLTARRPPPRRRLSRSLPQHQGRLRRSAEPTLDRASAHQGSGICAKDVRHQRSQRWEIETSFDELKTHQGAPRMVLRSQTPGGVQQEVYGFLLVHYAIRSLMHQAALDGGIDPDRVSFTRTLRLARRQVPAQAALSPLTAGPRADPGPG